MSAILFPVLQFFDDAGAPLADGKIYFYESDGSTPQAAYTNAAGNVPLANPTTLDSAGRANSGAGIWLGLNLTYTIIVKDSDDATVLTLSNVTPNSAGIAPSSASYITATAEAGLSAERVLTGTANQITVTDGGSTATLSVPYQFNLGSSASGPSELRLFEDTDNGAHKVTIIAPAAITSDRTITLPDNTGTVLLDSDIGTTVAEAGSNTDITSVYLNNTGLVVKDTNASHGLIIAPGSDLTADRTLTLTTGDSNRTLTLSGDLTVGANSSISGTAYVAGGTNVAIADGGTGADTASAAFSALSPITTTGDIIYSSSGTTNSRLAIGTSDQTLVVAGGIPSWSSRPLSPLKIRSNGLIQGGAAPYAVMNMSASTHDAGANELVFMPLFIPYTQAYSSLKCEVTTSSASGNINIGLYAHDPSTGGPTGAPITMTGSLSTGTTGTKSGGTPGTLMAGMYWIAYVVDTNGNAAQFNCISGSSFAGVTGGCSLGLNDTSTSINIYNVWLQSFTYSATLPSVSGATLTGTGSSVACFVEAA